MVESKATSRGLSDELRGPQPAREGGSMKATEKLHDLGQSLWLDNITRGLLTSGTLERYIREFSITGLTSNPSIFDHAIRNTPFYDDAVRGIASDGQGDAAALASGTWALISSANPAGMRATGAAITPPMCCRFRPRRAPWRRQDCSASS